MSDRPTWDSEWRALAEKELRGAPFASLASARHDALAVVPALGPDPSREEGLGDAPAARSILAVVVHARDLPLARDADGVWWRGPDTAPDDESVRLVETAAEPSIVEALLRSAAGVTKQSVVALTDVHESGGSVVTEVAIGIAAVVELARRRSGPPPDFRLAVAVGPELYLEIAKLRALRRLARRVLATLEIDARIWIAARTAERSAARLDAPTNAVRATLGAAAAMIGGADVVGVLPMDVASPEPGALGARLARNTAQILARESSLLAVDDPARGSFAIEALTDTVAREAWEVVREIERAGGLVAARALVRARIERDGAARRAALRSRRVPIVGVSKFPLAAELAPVPLDDARDASAFELARSRPGVPVEIVAMGEGIDARVDFVRDVLGVVGAELVATGAGRVAIVCAPDAAFGTDVPAALARLAVPAFVAGKPGVHERVLRDAGARGFLALGQDLIVFADALRAAATESEATRVP